MLFFLLLMLSIQFEIAHSNSVLKIVRSNCATVFYGIYGWKPRIFSALLLFDFISATSRVIFRFSLSHFISHCGFVLDFINIKTQRIWSINVIISIEWREERICQRVYFTWITYPFSFLISIVMLFFYQVIKDVPVNIIHSRFVVLFFIYLEPLRWLPHSMQCEKFLVVTERRFRNGRTNRMRRERKKPTHAPTAKSPIERDQNVKFQ